MSDAVPFSQKPKDQIIYGHERPPQPPYDPVNSKPILRDVDGTFLNGSGFVPARKLRSGVKASVVEMLHKELHRRVPDAKGGTRTIAEVIARKLVLRALDGDLTAINSIIDRVDGKPVQAVAAMIGGVGPDTSMVVAGAVAALTQGLGIESMPEVIDVEAEGDGGSSEGGSGESSAGGESGPGGLRGPDDEAEASGDSPEAS